MVLKVLVFMAIPIAGNSVNVNASAVVCNGLTSLKVYFIKLRLIA